MHLLSPSFCVKGVQYDLYEYSPLGFLEVAIKVLVGPWFYLSTGEGSTSKLMCLQKFGVFLVAELRTSVFAGCWLGAALSSLTHGTSFGNSQPCIVFH